MNGIESFIVSGKLIEVLAVVVLLEVLVLLAYWRRTGRGISPTSLILNVGAGAALIGALWSSFVSAHAWTVLPWLAVSLALHIFDLKKRWHA